jgi:chromosome segregation ATPase
MDNKIQELKDATREANEALKDLRKERKEVRELKKEIEVLLGPATHKIIEDTLSTHINNELKELTEEMEKLLKEGIKSIGIRCTKEYDRLMRRLLGTIEGEGPTIREVIEAVSVIKKFRDSGDLRAMRKR